MTTGLPLVLVHGFSQTARSWDPVRTELAAMLPVSPESWAPAQIIAPDLPGHGIERDRPRDLASAAVALADRIGPAHYVGYSMGGRVCLHLAALRPDVVAGLVLINTTAGIDDPAQRAQRREADHRLAARIEAIGVEAFIDEWLAQPMFATLPVDPERIAERLENSASGLADSLRLAGTGEQQPLWDRLGHLRAPTLVITGALDHTFTELGHRLIETIAGATLAVVPDAGHAVHLERPAVVAHLLAQWLAGLDGASDQPAGSDR
jgi:2-succinyl-6-hydroxy-2,4-cyclohexadiene-1-carboxylate synthase